MPSLRILITLLLWGSIHPCLAQQKAIHSPDASLGNVGIMLTSHISATGIPGRALALCGMLDATAPGPVRTRAAFLMLLDGQGLPAPQNLLLLRDTLSSAITPRSYAALHDGQGHFYHALGSRGKQILVKTDTLGSVIWAREWSHHEFLDLALRDTFIYAMGNDESILGYHDFSIAKVDSAGRSLQGAMYGTEWEELPEEMLPLPDGRFLMAGRVFHGPSSSFHIAALKTDSQLDLAWGRTYGSPGKGLQCKGMAIAPDGSGYVYAGKATGGNDSIFLAKLDTAGNPLWLHIYGLESPGPINALDVEADPSSGALLLCGEYRGPTYDRAFVLRTDASGNAEWARTYGPLAVNIKESLEHLLVQDGQFVAVGNRMRDSSFIYQYSAITVHASTATGELDCDSILNFGQRTASLNAYGSMLVQPFIRDSAAVILGQSSLSSASVSCTLTVGHTPPQPAVSMAYPSPTPGDFRVALQAPSSGTLRLCDMAGRPLWMSALRPGWQEIEVPASGIPAGLYLLSADGDGWRARTGRVVVTGR